MSGDSRSQVAGAACLGDSATKHVVVGLAQGLALSKALGAPCEMPAGETRGALKVDGESSTPQSSAAVTSADGVSPPRQPTSPSSVVEGDETLAELGTSLGMGDDKVNDDKETGEEGDGYWPLGTGSLVVQSSVSVSTGSLDPRGPFVPACRDGAVVPTETRETYTSNCVDDYRTSRRHGIEPELDVVARERAAGERRAAVGEIFRLAILAHVPGAGPASPYQTDIEEGLRD